MYSLRPAAVAGASIFSVLFVSAAIANPSAMSGANVHNRGLIQLVEEGHHNDRHENREHREHRENRHHERRHNGDHGDRHRDNHRSNHEHGNNHQRKDEHHH